MAKNNRAGAFAGTAASVNSLENMIRTVRPEIRALLTGEKPCDPADVAEVLTQLLAYNMAIEQVLSSAAGRSGTLPGHSVSVRGYVSQALSGEAREASIQRLTEYFKSAIVFFVRTHSDIQKAIDQFAENLVEALQPSRIEERVRPGAFLSFFGAQDVAYWREFRKQFRSLDAAGVRQLADSQGREAFRDRR